MTPIESLIDRVLPFIDRTKVSDVELQGIVEEHIAMEKEKMIEFASYYTPLTKEELEIGFKHKFKSE